MSKALIIWPEYLDVPLREGYDYSPADRRAKADMEIGGRYRIMFDTDETVMNCSFLLKHDQLAFFEAFEKHLLKQGSIWFEMPILVSGDLERHRVRFRERPKMGDFRSGMAIVSMVLDVERRKTFSEDEILLLYLFSGTESFLYAEDLLQIIMNEKLPLSLPGRNH